MNACSWFQRTAPLHALVDSLFVEVGLKLRPFPILLSGWVLFMNAFGWFLVLDQELSKVIRLVPNEDFPFSHETDEYKANVVRILQAQGGIDKGE